MRIYQVRRFWGLLEIQKDTLTHAFHSLGLKIKSETYAPPYVKTPVPVGSDAASPAELGSVHLA